MRTLERLFRPETSSAHNGASPQAQSQRHVFTTTTDRILAVTTPPAVHATGIDNGRMISITVGDTLAVTLGPGWTAPQVYPLGGDPGPVTTPLQTQPGTRGANSAVTFAAVSAGQALVTAQPTATYRSTAAALRVPFELTVNVRPRLGMAAPLGAG